MVSGTEAARSAESASIRAAATETVHVAPTDDRHWTTTPLPPMGVGRGSAAFLYRVVALEGGGWFFDGLPFFGIGAADR